MLTIFPNYFGLDSSEFTHFFLKIREKLLQLKNFRQIDDSCTYIFFHSRKSIENSLVSNSQKCSVKCSNVLRVACVFFISNLKVVIVTSRSSFLVNSRIFHLQSVLPYRTWTKHYKPHSVFPNFIIVTFKIECLSSVIKNRLTFKIKNKYSFNWLDISLGEINFISVLSSENRLTAVHTLFNSLGNSNLFDPNYLVEIIMWSHIIIKRTLPPLKGLLFNCHFKLFCW